MKTFENIRKFIFAIFTALSAAFVWLFGFMTFVPPSMPMAAILFFVAGLLFGSISVWLLYSDLNQC